MPYDSVEEAVKSNKGLEKYSDKAKRGWLEGFNKCMNDGGPESKCFAIAYSIANDVDGKKSSSRTRHAFIRNSPQNQYHLAMYSRLMMLWNQFGPNCRYADEDCADITFGYDAETKKSTMRLRLYSAQHEYAIVVSADPGERVEDWYLGAIASNRYMRPTEDWTRGSDLPDGKFMPETWRDIVSAIAGYELLNISEYAEEAQIRHEQGYRGVAED